MVNCKVGEEILPKWQNNSGYVQIHPDCMKNGGWTHLMSLSTKMLNILEPVE